MTDRWFTINQVRQMECADQPPIGYAIVQRWTDGPTDLMEIFGNTIVRTHEGAVNLLQYLRERHDDEPTEYALVALHVVDDFA